jgi:riboflavin synthase
MFTGIIQTVGTLDGVETRGGDLRLTIDAAALDPARMQQGDSVAVAGVCLTVAERTPNGFIADVSRETLALTTISQWHKGTRVNLEAALRASDALGGHLVLGHVDGCAELLDFHGDGRSQRLQFRAPPSLSRYLARKGAVALDGVSLTVNEVASELFGVNLVPFTLSATTLAGLRPGAQVNLEVDLMARYAERLLEFK